MTDTPAALTPLWSDNRIKLLCSKLETREDVKHHAYLLLMHMRNDYERDRAFWANERQQLRAELVEKQKYILKLERELAKWPRGIGADER